MLGASTAAITPLGPEDADAFRALIEDPTLAAEHDNWQGRIHDVLVDPFAPPELRWLARDGGAVVGFAYVFVLPTHARPWSIIRVGVLESHRRRGIGSRLFETANARLEQQAPDVDEIVLSNWQPNPAAAGFAAHHGFVHARYTWLMERPRGETPDIHWPAGIEVRLYDGSEALLEDWNDVCNRSFADHRPFVVSTVETCRKVSQWEGFHRDGLLLAYREGRSVGFCRCHQHGDRAEVAMLGVAPEARRIGLGRALLRWGTAWIEGRPDARITLMVVGENERAIRLYRSEGYEATRTRDAWSRRR